MKQAPTISKQRAGFEAQNVRTAQLIIARPDYVEGSLAHIWATSVLEKAEREQGLKHPERGL